MEKVYIGKVVATHGIKGEIRIKSDFPFKDKVFQIGKSLIIDEKEYRIKSYRVHKDFDMVTLDDYNNINQVLFLLKKKVYVNKEELQLNDNEILDEELLTYTVYSKDGRKGQIKEIFYASETNKIIRVEFDREVLIPMNSPMIKQISKKNHTIEVELIDGM